MCKHITPRTGIRDSLFTNESKAIMTANKINTM
jgi:hypothetical protein